MIDLEDFAKAESNLIETVPADYTEVFVLPRHYKMDGRISVYCGDSPWLLIKGASDGDMIIPRHTRVVFKFSVSTRSWTHVPSGRLYTDADGIELDI